MASERNRTEEKKTYTVGEIAEMLGIAAAKANARESEPVNFSVPNVSVNPPADL